jgi:hypothetical protein
MTNIALEGKCTQTAIGDSFLLFDDNQPTIRIIVFVTTENLRDVANPYIFFCDGTFYTCPNLIYQIYSIHIPIDDVMTPVIYAFFPGKSQATYTRFFTLIKDEIADLGLVFSPASAITDFETAVHNSIREVFPDINTKGCFSTSSRVYGEKHRQQDFKYHTETTSRLWFDEQRFYRLYLLHQLKMIGSKPLKTETMQTSLS